MRLWNDILRSASHINRKRVTNLSKLYLSFWLSRIIRRSVHWGMPFAVSVEPGTACTLLCPECPTGVGVLNRPKGSLSLSWYEKLLTELSPQLTVLNLYLQGEPLLHPDFTKMVKMASAKNIYVITSTNGQQFNEKTATELVEAGLSEIYFSLDGLTQHTYEKYRKGGDIEKVKDAIRALSRAKKKQGKRDPLIVAQFIVFKHNEHEVTGFKKMALELGADKAEIKSAQFNKFSTNEVEPPQSNKFRRYSSEGATGFKNHRYHHCWKSWMSAVFTWDGKVLPCCFDKDGDYELGNVTENSFETIWKGAKNDLFRKTILKSKNKISICSNCPEGRSFFT